MSKKDRARKEPANRPPPDEVDHDRPGAADAGLEELSGSGEEVLPAGDSSPASAPAAQQEIERLRAQLEEAEDRALRSRAELENYRKRAAREIEQERRYANVPLIRDLLPVWDDMGRAIEAAEKTDQTANLLEGFKMVAGQLQSVLKRHHCVPIDAMGQPFDPHLHEAIYQQPSDAHPPGTVLAVAQTGFRVHDRVVRPSQVVVSAAPTSEQHPADAEPQ